MNPIPIGGPAVEPVSVVAAREHLRVDTDAEDALIGQLVRAARAAVEAAAGRALIEQSWRLRVDRWPAGRLVRLPVSPLLAVDRVAVMTAGGVEADLPPSAYAAEGAADPPTVLAAPQAPDPAVPRAGIVIDWRAGYASAPEGVSEPLRLAVLRLIARWFENRGDLPGAEAAGPDILALVAPFRRPRL
jgi:uncharacterized phiE125 gp8 family phage protein